ncbi:hypothetical protein C8R44DRAFT_753648 [Mycena epipterygia]|nr:hypothetical protein C8R44DRAFT_753648 [Mycena epipterygia]
MQQTMISEGEEEDTATDAMATVLVVITVDDRCTFYTNGAHLGSSPNVTDISAQIFCNTARRARVLRRRAEVIVANPATATPSLTTATWIWNSTTAAIDVPAGGLAFHRTFTSCASKAAASAAIVITTDDQFSLWVDGALVGSAPDEPDVWETAQMRAESCILASINILYPDGSNKSLMTDASWPVSPASLTVSASSPAGWQDVGFDDSAWGAAVGLGVCAVKPWGTGERAGSAGKVFGVSTQATSARLYYAAGGYATVALNGVPVSDHILSPGLTKYDTRMYAELARSHFGVTQGSVWNWAGAPCHGEPVLRLVLNIAYSEGTSERVVSDASWKVIEGPTRLDDAFGGENFNGCAAKGHPRECVPAANVGHWVTPWSITEPVPGQFVATLERVVAGPAGTLITVHSGEKLDPDGMVIYSIRLDVAPRLTALLLDNFQTDRLWLAGTGAPGYPPSYLTADSLSSSTFILIPALIYAYGGDVRVLTHNYAGMKAYIEFELGHAAGSR